jgi:hypothetical protein
MTAFGPEAEAVTFLVYSHRHCVMTLGAYGIPDVQLRNWQTSCVLVLNMRGVILQEILASSGSMAQTSPEVSFGV